MSAEDVIADIIAALELPASAQVGQRVPKKLLTENGAPTGADKRAINDGVEELIWLAALKPNTIGVPDYRDDVREYLEIAILHLTLRASAKCARLIALTHRAIPYPVLLLVARPDGVGISAVHKRWSQGEAGKTVLDGDIIEVSLAAVRDDALASAFCDALSLGRQPQTTLYTLYQGWIDTLLALQAACVTGKFATPTTAAHATARREALREFTRLETEMARLRSAAAKEKQLPRLLEFNLELKRLQARQAAATAKL